MEDVGLRAAHCFVFKDLWVATMGVAPSQLPDLEERIPVDVINDVFYGHILEDLCA
jgi:hypothetical protein